jgi:hypothetical protein
MKDKAILLGSETQCPLPAELQDVFTRSRGSPAAHTAGSSSVGLWPFGNQWVAAVRGLTATALVVSASGLLRELG